MHVVVRSFGTRLVDTSVCQSAADLKCLLASEDGLPLEDIRLYSGTSVLDSDTILADLPADCAIDVSVGVLGGKVHGSLARAGKVRGQTPKVEKQDKKKQPRGRAKRRMQYNRRFFAVVASTGLRRRGPNSNFKPT
ncbi:40S ribosomal protein S30-B [Echinococcus granulosus]|uniref:Small subunit ribosomal protein s30e n=1 Tax=Echinococcus granulosus TaxID=6210 RepID=A0A068WER2_ECHGR|nr:40S ribosomal protein S30-B [Echinococcus granulosus]CDS16136.1 small subunit ribosomal protein s30e [Echinococcus granulosus]